MVGLKIPSLPLSREEQLSYIENGLKDFGASACERLVADVVA